MESKGIELPPIGEPTTGAAKVDTKEKTQGTLDPSLTYINATPSYMQPSWGEKYLTGFKKAGLGLSCVLCGALAIGLLPFTLVGGAVFGLGLLFDMGGAGEEHPDPVRVARSREKGAILMTAGMVLAAPATGLFYCMNELKEMPRLKQLKLEYVTNLFKDVITNKDPTLNTVITYKDQTLDTGYCIGLCKDFTRNELIKIHKDIQTFNPDSPVSGRKQEILQLVENFFKVKFGPKTS